MPNDLTFTTLAYLGDSLTDSGEIYDLTEAAIGYGLPESPIYDEQLSNGPVYADIAPALLGVTGNLNFAVGGAKAKGDRTIRDYVDAILDGEDFGALTQLYLDFRRLDSSARRAQDTVMDLTGQVERLIDDVSSGARGDVAVSVLIGGNDLDPRDFGSFADAQAEIIDVTGTIFAEVETLLGAGFGTVLLNTLPSGSFFPAVSAEGPQIEALADLMTASYNSVLKGYADATANVEIIDLGLMADEVAADIRTFGFTNIEGSILPGRGGGSTPTTEAINTPWDQFVFVDTLHPSAEMHEIWGIFQAEALASDYATGTTGSDAMDLGNCDDFVLGLYGHDTITARGGDDVVLAGHGHDSVRGGAGDDVLSGGSGRDTLAGQANDDLLAGNYGNDLLMGMGGNDILVDGDGSDTVAGGYGNDIFIFTEAELFEGTSDDTDIFYGGKGNDTLVLQLTQASLLVAEASQQLLGNGSVLFDTLGITAWGMETILFVGYGGAADALSVSGDQAQLLAEAELWNFI